MTSSLVGSEMCIRGREASAEGRGGLAFIVTSPRTNIIRLRGSDLVAGEAVSYTHLTLPTICSV
eukprot:2688425-Prorocentrum_lima.AAC.1